MKKFISTLAKYILFTFLVSLTVLVIYLNTGDNSFRFIPPPEFSKSISFNDKLAFSKDKTADVLAIGSSMSLNNLSSSVVVKNLQHKSYLNLSSWGLKMEHMYDLLKIYSKKHMPNTLILSSHYIDFSDHKEDNAPKFEISEVEDYINSKWSLKFYVTNFNLYYYIDNYIFLKDCKRYRNIYNSLKYDKYGGSEINSRKLEINKERWVNSCINVIKTNVNYEYLDSISKFCSHNKIRLLFFETPVRKKVLDDTTRILLNNHIQKVEKIITKNKFSFVNSNEIPWDDSFFIDGTHLSSKGARRFTNYCFDNL